MLLDFRCRAFRLSRCSHARTHLASPPARTTYRCGFRRGSNATHQCQAAVFVARDRDSAIELELDPTPATADVEVKPSVSVRELGPSAVASALTSARAELPWTYTSMLN